ncbi:PepSY domain-containing protein [Tenacibaculum maritimum]|uniref:NADPH--hemoprotein reductase n=1 Tax=Tenacibaculum maritimum NCIMB 2154 TaxID=1349785 RepID=A0A2H1E9T3_9FLAO|nr:PepSY domain-containing protein [Tenacibaculum maritimum]SFZ81830.1 Flavodoxin/nitric oxide synthase [Tenacibaculum maritimum NCIMB 2154]
MITSIWRYSHLTLAISSFIFILIASITGGILALEPITNQLKTFTIKNSNEISLSKTIYSLQREYPEIVTIQVDDNNFVIASIINKDGKSESFYINPTTGKKMGNLIERNPIYKWVTNLHRSLFLKSTGRFIVGFISLLLFLIAITGTILIIKRQGGLLLFFKKIIKEKTHQYYHVILGKYTLIPIIIITITGVYLSLEKFSLLPKTKTSYQISSDNSSILKKIPTSKFPIFKNTFLNNLKSLEFPFSAEEEDYFFLKLKDKELFIHQYSGEIISTQKLSFSKILLDWSLFLHTGRGTLIWSSILLLTCCCILFFIYSGFSITFTRNQHLPKNKHNKDKAEYIILVGSETGNTFKFANSLAQALSISKKIVFIDSLNNYSSYKSAQFLFILTATYGEGAPPTNAKKFLTTFPNITPSTTIKYTVIGFGSLAYKNYCKFAIQVDSLLQNHPNFEQIMDLYKINNQSFSDFKNWEKEWNHKNELKLAIPQKIASPRKQQTFTIIKRTALNQDNVFLLHLAPLKKITFTSGDLLSITPHQDSIERLYSIGAINGNIILSIKKHEFGVCSNFLNTLQQGDNIQAHIKKNKAFNLPKKTKEAILIANGTGIAPFLGMLEQPSIQKHLFFGVRTINSLDIYAPFLKNSGTKTTYIAYSKELSKEKKYVQDLILENQHTVANTLKNDGIIMICGSISMMNGTLKILEEITLNILETPLKTYWESNQIKTDCY